MHCCMINPPPPLFPTLSVLLLRAEKGPNVCSESGMFKEICHWNHAWLLQACDEWVFLSPLCVCVYMCVSVITLYKSQQTLWNSSAASWKTFCFSTVRAKHPASAAATTTNPKHPTAWPPFFILGFVTASPVIVCNSRLLLGVSTFLCLYSVCLWVCVCVCHISTISPRWPKYWQTVFNWGKLNGSNLNGAQTEAPQWRATLWLLTCNAHCRSCYSLCACQGRLNWNVFFLHSVNLSGNPESAAKNLPN